MNIDSGSFTGFTPKALVFLQALAVDNRKEWFEEHRDDFVDLLQKPLQQMVTALSGPLLAIDPDLVTIPSRVVSRIHRDIRFSRNKSPYKTTMWLTFKRQDTEWRDAPCWFFEITADTYRFGMGFYSASKETMDQLRKTIEQKPAKFRQAVAFLAKQNMFVLEGEMYRRTLRSDLSEDLQCWHKRKNIYLVCNRRPDIALFKRELVDDLRKGFETLAPFYDFLWKVKKLAGIC